MAAAAQRQPIRVELRDGALMAATASQQPDVAFRIYFLSWGLFAAHTSPLSLHTHHMLYVYYKYTSALHMEESRVNIYS